MDISVIGNKGVVGSATEQTLRRLGHSVFGSDKGEEIASAEAYMICVPEKVVPEVVTQLLNKRGVIVVRSTVLPGTCQKFKTMYPYIYIGSNPEFLKESSAFWDLYFSKHILIGPCDKLAEETIRKIWEPMHVPIIVTKSTTSEMIKLCTNVYAATLISFWNMIKEITDKIGVNADEVARIASIIDERVSPYGIITGKAFGGKCLPKDLNQLLEFCAELEYEPDFLKVVKQVNERQTTENDFVRGSL